jgi:hypothetical protein
MNRGRKAGTEYDQTIKYLAKFGKKKKKNFDSIDYSGKRKTKAFTWSNKCREEST